MKSTYWIALLALLLAACGEDDPKESDPSNNSNNPNNSGTLNNTSGSNNTGGSNNNTTPATNNATGNPTNNSTSPNNSSADVTYHGHVRAILEANCSQCHYEGGIGPFALDDYDVARPMASVIATAVEAGTMPPWPPAEDCGEFRDPKIVTPEEKVLLRTWADIGMPEGDPADYVPPVLQAPTNLGTPDFVVDIGTDYVPNPAGQAIDDYHCFAIDTNFTEDRFLSAYETRPGNIGTVHHMLFWAVGSDKNARIQELENEDPTTPGWKCFGGNRVDDVRGMLGGWVPGTAAVQYGENRGIRIPANSKVIVQIHYNILNNQDSDRTLIDLHLSDGEPAEKLSMFPFPVNDLYVPAGEANGYASGTVSLPINTKLYGVFPHMHQLGTRIKASGTRGGNETCYVDIPEWDFGWQNIYLYEAPIDISSGTSIKLECWYDNSPANQVNGQMPRDVRWGEGTFDEMCLNYFVIRELPFQF